MPDQYQNLEASEYQHFDPSAYLIRIKDRLEALAHDDPIFLPARPLPENTKVKEAIDKTARKLIPTAPSPEENERMKQLYLTTAAAPAEKTFDRFSSEGITEVLPGKAWVLPNVFTPEECQDVIQRGQAWGLRGSKNSEIRSNKRTNDYMDFSLSTMVKGKLTSELLDRLEQTWPFTGVRAVHPNWRVASYLAGEQFVPHYDNSDHMHIVTEAGAKERLVTSHTLLIFLTDRDTFEGGATRLYPNGRYDEGSVDVMLPQGWGLVFQQKGMLHAGAEVVQGNKWIAQAGILRGQSEEIREAPSLFKPGPGFRLNNPV